MIKQDIKAPNYDIANHIRDLAKHSAKRFHDISNDEHKEVIINRSKTDYQSLSDDINKDIDKSLILDNHQKYIINYLISLYQKHPYSAHMLCLRLIRECQKILSQDTHINNHETIDNLKTSIKDIHEIILEKLRETYNEKSYTKNEIIGVHKMIDDIHNHHTKHLIKHKNYKDKNK